MRISVVGGGRATDIEVELAEAVGRELASRGHAVVCGGRGGVMHAVCQGARAGDGHTIGILPGESREDANPHVETAIATGVGHARNAIVVLNGDGVIAIDGGPGTLSEIAYARIYDRPVAGLRTHEVDGVEAVDTPVEAVEYVESEARSR